MKRIAIPVIELFALWMRRQMQTKALQSTGLIETKVVMEKPCWAVGTRALVLSPFVFDSMLMLAIIAIKVIFSIFDCAHNLSWKSLSKLDSNDSTLAVLHSFTVLEFPFDLISLLAHFVREGANYSLNNASIQRHWSNEALLMHKAGFRPF